jgi:L-ascorbate metabolism protein UlaG (beta-lactamase superfamily)
MKITKYPQSCLLLEKNGQRIVIDPGKFFAEKYSFAELGEISAVLYTHRHGDHLDAAIFEQLKQNGTPSYGNADVCELLGEGVTQVTSGQVFEVAGFQVKPHDIKHFQKDPAVEPPQNTGYIIDGNFFHPGDGVVNNGVHVTDFAAPVGGPFRFDLIIEFIKSVGAKRVIPIHYSNQTMYPVDPNEFTQQAQAVAEIILLEDGQSTDL